MSWNNEHPLKSSVGYASCLHIQRKNYVEIRKSYAINSSIHIQNKMREDFRTRTHNFIGHFYDFISKLIMLFAPIRKQNGEYQKSGRIRNISLCLAAQISAFHNDSLSSSWTLLEFILRSNSFELVAAAFVSHYGNLQWISICTRTPLPQINVSLMWGSIKVHLLWNGSDFIECMLWTRSCCLFDFMPVRLDSWSAKILMNRTKPNHWDEVNKHRFENCSMDGKVCFFACRSAKHHTDFFCSSPYLCCWYSLYILHSLCRARLFYFFIIVLLNLGVLR